MKMLERIKAGADSPKLLHACVMCPTAVFAGQYHFLLTFTAVLPRIRWIGVKH